MKNTPADSHGNRGFTLIEILVVLAIMGALAAISIPAISGMMRTNDLGKALYDLEGILAQARSHALAQNTYVWVEFGASAENGDIKVKVVSSKNQRRELDEPNLLQLGRARQFKNVGLSGSLPEFGDRHSAEVSIEPDQWLEFNPVGEARAVSNSGGTLPAALNKWIEIGLQPARGSASARANYAALQVAGLTGQIRIFRP